MQSFISTVHYLLLIVLRSNLFLIWPWSVIILRSYEGIVGMILIRIHIRRVMVRWVSCWSHLNNFIVLKFIWKLMRIIISSYLRKLLVVCRLRLICNVRCYVVILWCVLPTIILNIKLLYVMLLLLLISLIHY